jgi:hypothetical protein
MLYAVSILNTNYSILLSTFYILLFHQNIFINFSKKKSMLKNIPKSELMVIIAAVVFIFVSEYYYLIVGDHDRGIFLGLWPPTMIILLMYVNSKKQN